MNFSDFKIIEKIYESDISIVYRAVTLTDLTPVILKTLNRDYPTAIELTFEKNPIIKSDKLTLPNFLDMKNDPLSKNISLNFNE